MTYVACMSGKLLMRPPGPRRFQGKLVSVACLCSLWRVSSCGFVYKQLASVKNFSEHTISTGLHLQLVQVQGTL